MIHLRGACAALVAAAVGVSAMAAAVAGDRSLPMRFELWREGPAESCGDQCRTWVSAKGTIIADTPRHFRAFAKGRDLRNAALTLNSDGGSVLGAIALGREIRRHGMTTTVGRTIEIKTADPGDKRATLSPRADCESMCTFVLLGGTHRSVPAQARVMVHQIWLGDRRDDPMAANYSAEDLVVVQRDIGRLAQYAAEMGATAELLEMSLRIPPWEPMRPLSRAELHRMRIDNSSDPAERAVIASAGAAAIPAGDSVRTVASGKRGWAVVDHGGETALARRHPLTVEGEEIGKFNLVLTCGDGGGYRVSYLEKRSSASQAFDKPLEKVVISIGTQNAGLAVVSSQRRVEPSSLDSVASAVVPAEMVNAFAHAGRSLTITTLSAGTRTSIRVGSSGVAKNLPVLAENCRNAASRRVELPANKTGGVAGR